MTNTAISTRPAPFPAHWAPQRRVGSPQPQIVVVGASTGGPQALIALIGSLAPILQRIPVCVSLHMPPELMPLIAAHVTRTCAVPTSVVTEMRRLELGVVYFAPGDRHLTFQRTALGIEMALVASKPGELCKPAIDVMFASAAACFGSRTLGIVLSGMGKDGLVGAKAIVAAGGVVLAQDKESSAVWGMPGAVTKADLATAVLDPRAIGLAVLARAAERAGFA